MVSHYRSQMQLLTAAVQISCFENCTAYVKTKSYYLHGDKILKLRSFFATTLKY